MFYLHSKNPQRKILQSFQSRWEVSSSLFPPPFHTITKATHYSLSFVLHFKGQRAVILHRRHHTFLLVKCNTILDDLFHAPALQAFRILFSSICSRASAQAVSSFPSSAYFSSITIPVSPASGWKCHCSLLLFPHWISPASCPGCAEVPATSRDRSFPSCSCAQPCPAH